MEPTEINVTRSLKLKDVSIHRFNFLIGNGWEENKTTCFCPPALPPISLELDGLEDDFRIDFFY